MNSLVGRLVAIGLVLLLAVVVPTLSVYQIELVTQMLIYAIFAMSLDILLGYTGLPSLGDAAYFGLAAYATAILSLRLHVPFALAAPAGIAASVVAAALFNLLALRTSRGYYLMITLALSQLLWSLAVSWTELTGGDNGLPGLERPRLPCFPRCSHPPADFSISRFSCLSSPQSRSGCSCARPSVMRSRACARTKRGCERSDTPSGTISISPRSLRRSSPALPANSLSTSTAS
jgi:ABC-type branched-subunit amino acid transport system permease subunit